MLNRHLPLFIALLPVCAVTVAYTLAAAYELVPGCNPFLEGCTSISATGRYAPASYVFKPAHLLQSLMLAMLWMRLPRELPGGRRDIEAARISGLVGAAALVVYTLTLGSQTPLYEFMRRFGIYFFFAGTLLAQLLSALAYRSAAIARPRGGRWIPNAMLVVALGPLVLGIVNFAAKAVLADPDPTENRIEWIAALIMQGWFLLLYRYRRSGALFE
jgi:hypothetical protein